MIAAQEAQWMPGMETVVVIERVMALTLVEISDDVANNESHEQKGEGSAAHDTDNEDEYPLWGLDILRFRLSFVRAILLRNFLPIERRHNREG